MPFCQLLLVSLLLRIAPVRHSVRRLLFGDKPRSCIFVNFSVRVASVRRYCTSLL